MDVRGHPSHQVCAIGEAFSSGSRGSVRLKPKGDQFLVQSMPRARILALGLQGAEAMALMFPGKNKVTSRDATT